MLFNLTLQKLFKVTQQSNAIFCQYGYGPSFGGGNWGDLVTNEPFNGERMCRSCTNQSSYALETDADGRNILTNELSQKLYGYNISSFTISELEVWEVAEANPLIE